MKRSEIVVFVIVLFVTVAFVWMLVLSPMAGTGKAVSSAKGDDVSRFTDDSRKGFIAYCDIDSCVTLPTVIERKGEEWQLGVYDSGEKMRLAYRSAEGALISLDEAFGE